MRSPFISAMRLAVLELPQAGEFVGSGRGDDLPIRTHGDGGHGTAVIHAGELLSGGQVPNANAAVFAAGNELRPAGSTTASDVTAFVCPFNSRTGMALPGVLDGSSDHARITPSEPAVNNCVPVLFKAMALTAAGVDTTLTRAAPSRRTRSATTYRASPRRASGRLPRTRAT